MWLSPAHLIFFAGLLFYVSCIKGDSLLAADESPPVERAAEDERLSVKICGS